VALLDQLATGGRMVVPVGGGEEQSLLVIDKTGPTAFNERAVAPVRFVPMVHRTDQK